MTRETPLVSICCTTYRHERFIAAALDGFLAQRIKFPFEILVHDDASPDTTPSIIAAYAERHPDIVKPIYQTQNQYSRGIKPQIAFNFPRAQGRYIALCEGDDVWTDPLKLQTQVDFLETHPEYVLSFHQVQVADEENRPTGSILGIVQDVTAAELRLGQWVPTLSLCFRNLPILRDMPPEIHTVLAADIFLLTVLGRFGDGKYLGDRIRPGIYHAHTGGVWSGLPKERQMMETLRTHMQICGEQLKDLGTEQGVAYFWKRVFPAAAAYGAEFVPKARMDELRRSWSYRIGRAITWLPAFLLKLFRR